MAQNFLYKFEFVVEDLLITRPNYCAPEEYPTCCEITFRSNVFVSICDREFGRCVDMCGPKCAKCSLFSLESPIVETDRLLIHLYKKRSENCKFLLGASDMPVKPLFDKVNEKFDLVNINWKEKLDRQFARWPGRRPMPPKTPEDGPVFSPIPPNPPENEEHRPKPIPPKKPPKMPEDGPVFSPIPPNPPENEEHRPKPKPPKILEDDCDEDEPDRKEQMCPQRSATKCLIPLFNMKKRQTGNVTLLIRLVCYGPNIVTSFPFSRFCSTGCGVDPSSSSIKFACESSEIAPTSGVCAVPDPCKKEVTPKKICQRYFACNADKGCLPSCDECEDDCDRECPSGCEKQKKRSSPPCSPPPAKSCGSTEKRVTLKLHNKCDGGQSKDSSNTGEGECILFEGFVPVCCHGIN